MEQIAIGNGGWVRADLVDLPGPLYVRLSLSTGGRWTTTELYVDGRGEPVTGAMMRALPVTQIEDIANGEEFAAALADRAGLERVLLSEAASFYASGFGPQAKHWVALMHRSQSDGSQIGQAPATGDAVHAEAPPLRAPDEGLTAEFLRSVARAYEYAKSRPDTKNQPAIALAEQAGPGVSIRNVHRWIYLARKAGHLRPSSRTTRQVGRE